MAKWKFGVAGALAVLAFSMSAMLGQASAAATASAIVVSSCGTPPSTYTAGLPFPITQDTTGKACGSSAASIAGSTSNASSGVATSSNNIPTVAYNYGFNGTTWDQLQVDASKFLKVNCATGCSGGTFNNNADAVATSATNGQAAAWLYGFNGTTWDRLRVDGSKNLDVLINGPIAAGTNVIGHVIVDSGTITNVTTVSTVTAVTTITNALPAGTNVIGHVIVDSAAGVAQGSTTSGQTLSPIGCRTLTSAPSDTTAQTNMPWCRVNGAMALDLASINATTVLTGGVNGSLGVGGLAATNATPSGNPIAISGTAESAEPTLATNGQNATLATDLAHKLIVSPYANPENFVSGTTAAMTGTTSTSLIAAPASGLRNYITQIQCVNSHATVGTFVTVQDGSGGTALMTLAAASVFGGETVTLPVPLRQPTTATAIFVADVTTGANVICSATGYKGQ